MCNRQLIYIYFLSHKCNTDSRGTSRPVSALHFLASCLLCVCLSECLHLLFYSPGIGQWASVQFTQRAFVYSPIHSLTLVFYSLLHFFSVHLSSFPDIAMHMLLQKIAAQLLSSFWLKQLKYVSAKIQQAAKSQLYVRSAALYDSTVCIWHMVGWEGRLLSSSVVRPVHKNTAQFYFSHHFTYSTSFPGLNTLGYVRDGYWYWTEITQYQVEIKLLQSNNTCIFFFAFNYRRRS